MSIVGGQGGTDLGAMLGLLADPVALQAKYAQLEEARRQSQEVVDLAGPANEILAIRAQIDSLKAQAEAAGVQAAAAAQAISEEATQRAQTIIAEANVKADALVAQAQLTVKAANEKMAAAVEEQRKVVKANDDLSVYRAALDQAHEENATNEMGLAQREKVLASRLDTLAKAQQYLADTIKSLSE